MIRHGGAARRVAVSAAMHAFAGRPARPPVLTVGTVVWLASELLFFAGLFAAYFTLRTNATGAWPPVDVELETVPAALFTLVLVASSLTVHRAARAAETGDTGGVRVWLVVTLLLAALFLGNQAREWASAGFSASSHAYGSAFFVMTGFHGLHVVGGMVAMAVVLVRADRPAVEVVTAYWHLVDVVWLAMFATLFGIR